MILRLYEIDDEDYVTLANYNTSKIHITVYELCQKGFGSGFVTHYNPGFISCDTGTGIKLEKRVP